MVHPELERLIRSYLAQGYSPIQVRQALIEQGWPAAGVEEVFSSAQRGRGWVWIASAALVVVIMVVGLAHVLLLKSPEQLLDVSVQPVKTDVAAGLPVDFIVELVNLGSSRRFDVHLRSELVSVSTNDVVASAVETVAIETRNAVRSQILVPPDAPPGRYVVRVIAEYDSQSARASFSLRVSEAQTPPERPQKECAGGCNDYDPCTTDRCKDGSCMHTSLHPCCGNQVCEAGESPESCSEDCGARQATREESVEAIMSRAGDMARSDPEGSVRLCKTLPVIKDHDGCLSGAAKQSGTPDICNGIVAERERDGCFLDVAISYDNFEVCNRVVDRWLKSSCYSYANLKASGR